MKAQTRTRMKGVGIPLSIATGGILVSRALGWVIFGWIWICPLAILFVVGAIVTLIGVLSNEDPPGGNTSIRKKAWNTRINISTTNNPK